MHKTNLVRPWGGLGEPWGAFKVRNSSSTAPAQDWIREGERAGEEQHRGMDRGRI